MRYRVFFSALLAFWSCSVLAESFSDSETLRSQIDIFLRDELRTEYRGTEADFEISVSNLDPRLKLHQCDVPVAHSIVSPRPYGTHISVKAQCSGTKPWTIYVPARIETYAAVVVTVRNLERGSVLTEADIALNRMNTNQAGAGHVRVPGEIVGMELKRRLEAGEPVRMLHIKSPQLVRKGDRVVMEAGNAGVSVVTSGRALANGQMGDQIRVQNEKSQRIVDAEIVAPGRVRVAL
jgi:flagellar basal body P-ring formation protein FlgA